MYDVESLEREWKKYRLKKQIPWIVLSLVVILILSVYLVFRTEFSSMLSDYFHDQNRTLSKIEKKQEHPALKTQVPTMLPKRESNLSVQKSESVKETNVSSPEKEKHPRMDIAMVDQEEVSSQERKRKHMTIVLTDRNAKDQKATRSAAHKSRKRTIKSAQESFSRSGSYRDALYVAKEYYRKGRYSSAQKWALIANNINNENEDSWLVFAKAKAKLGQRKDAEQVLSAYIKKSHSTKAKILLQKIKAGKI